MPLFPEITALSSCAASLPPIWAFASSVFLWLRDEHVVPLDALALQLLMGALGLLLLLPLLGCGGLG